MSNYISELEYLRTKTQLLERHNQLKSKAIDNIRKKPSLVKSLEDRCDILKDEYKRMEKESEKHLTPEQRTSSVMHARAVLEKTK